MAAQSSEADIILNRTNVALARSQRLVQSWLPPKCAAEEATQAENEDEESFDDGLDELGGVGSKRKVNDEGLPDGVVKRKKLSSNDKLLEQLLGKKAAQARKKSLQQHDASKNLRGPQHAAPKPLSTGAVPRKREAVSDDEDEGRAAAFKSRKTKAKPASAQARLEADDDVNTRQGDGDVRQGYRPDPVGDEVESMAALDVEPDEVKPVKKKAGSYLDELLSQKAAKKSKKKRKKSNPGDTAVQ